MHLLQGICLHVASNDEAATKRPAWLVHACLAILGKTYANHPSLDGSITQHRLR